MGYTFSEFEKFLNVIANKDLHQEISNYAIMNVASEIGTATKTKSSLLGSMLLAGISGLSAHGFLNKQYYNSPYQNNVSVNQNPM